MFHFANAMRIEKKNLSEKTSVGIGPVVDWIEIKSMEDLLELYKKKKRLPKQFWIGNGSNLLASERAKNLLFVNLSGEFAKIEYDGEYLDAGAGVKISSLLGFCTCNGLSGLEWMAGIPATLGGAIFMNAGAGGKSVLDYVKSINCFSDGKKVCLKEFDFAYRKGVEKKILSAKFKLEKKDKRTVINNIRANKMLRIARQPSGKSFGSVFKNPGKFYAGKLIEECGLKGKTIGDAVISEKHANFIINRGNATFEDVYSLISMMKEAVYKKFGIMLEKEVKIV